MVEVEGSDVGGFRIGDGVEELIFGVIGDAFSVVEDEEAGAEVLEHFEDMARDEECAAIIGEMPEVLSNFKSAFGVETDEGLVEDDEIRVSDECGGHGNFSGHAA